jgi:alpha-L-fucosidase
MSYLPTLASIRQHPLPDWYSDAKFGIFIHWGLYSVPAYAPAKQGDIQELFRTRSMAYVFAHQPYAEWYQNSLRIADSPVQEYHKQVYGAQYPYENFAAAFNRQAAQWDPDAWAELFERSGARYVVLVTKHHDGFTLWPSRYPNPHHSGYHAERDLVGELATAVRRRGLRFGTYYSSALDWSFSQRPICNLSDLLASGPVSHEYRRYVRNHWEELIERVQPEILWSDIGYPPREALPELFAGYYNRIPHGLVNDRWLQFPLFLRNPLARWLIEQIAVQSLKKGGMTQLEVPHCDYRTTEYTGMPEITPYKWEACRGIGSSFGYNQAESDADYMKAGDLVAQLIDLTSKNGNLLLNVGPRADGWIHPAQVAALEGMGAWLKTNGLAIYNTRPWIRFKDQVAPGVEVRYTCGGDNLYVSLTTPLPPEIHTLTLPNLQVPPGARLTLLDSGQPLAYQIENSELWVNLPLAAYSAGLKVIQITPWKDI